MNRTMIRPTPIEDEPASDVTRVRDVMSAILPVVNEDASIAEAVQLMCKCGVYAVSVTDAHGRVVAMVHESDLTPDRVVRRPRS